MTLLLNLALLVLGFAMLVKGADVFVDGAATIARRVGIPSLIVGLTIVAMGTSAPEAAISITSALHGVADITIGNVIGSNIMNILMVLGLTATVSVLEVERSTIRFEIPFMIVVSTVLLTLGVDGQVTLGDGAILWACFAVYLGYLFVMARKGEAADANVADAEASPKADDFIAGEKNDASAATDGLARGEARPVWMLVLLVIVGMGMVMWGSDLTVNAATELARAMGLSERVIGLTVIALGTSLPELVTCITAARKDEANIAIGNIVGSCIFNLLFVVGSTALVTPIPFAPEFRIDMVIAIASAALLWMCVLPRKRLSLVTGLPLLAAFVAYLVYLMS